MRALARVISQPASLEARRALAAEWEAAGDPRAELIRLQLELRELERQDVACDRQSSLEDQVIALLRAHRHEWAGPIADLVERCEFRRGLVAEITISVDQFVERGSELLALAPIQHLNLTAPFSRWAELCALPQLAQIVSLEIAQQQEFGDSEAKLLAASPYAASLRWLSFMGCNVGRSGVEALAASANLEKVVELCLESTRYDPAPRFFDDAGVVSIEPNARGEELARTYGKRPWLVGPPIELYGRWLPLRDLLAADDYGNHLTLSGADGDETRVLAHPPHGYALAVPGHPRLALDPRGLPRYMENSLT